MDQDLMLAPTTFSANQVSPAYSLKTSMVAFYSYTSLVATVNPHTIRMPDHKNKSTYHDLTTITPVTHIINFSAHTLKGSTTNLNDPTANIVAHFYLSILGRHPTIRNRIPCLITTTKKVYFMLCWEDILTHHNKETHFFGREAPTKNKRHYLKTYRLKYGNQCRTYHDGCLVRYLRAATLTETTDILQLFDE